MILASGCFDGLHSGHVDYLSAAKALCRGDELLAVAVAPDVYIRTAKAREPYWSQDQRADTVRALQDVDAVIAHDTPSVALVIRELRPRLFVKGPDWEGRLPEDVQLACQDVGTSIAFLETPGTHVSEVRG